MNPGFNVEEARRDLATMDLSPEVAEALRAKIEAAESGDYATDVTGSPDVGLVGKITSSAGQMMTAVGELMGGKTGREFIEARAPEPPAEEYFGQEIDDALAQAEWEEDRRDESLPNRSKIAQLSAEPAYMGGDRPGALVARQPGMAPGPGVVEPYRYHEPAPDFAEQAFRAAGMTDMADEVKASGEASEAYKRFADARYREALRIFKEEGYPIVRVDPTGEGGPEGFLQSMASSAASMITLGVSDELEGVGGPPQLRKALNRAKEEGVLMAAPDEVKMQRGSNIGGALTGGLLGVFAPGAAGGIARATAGESALTLMGGAAVAGGATAGGMKIAQLVGARLRGEPDREPSVPEVAEATWEGTLLGGLFGAGIEGLGALGGGAVRALREGPMGMQIRQLEHSGGSTTMRPGTGGVRKSPAGLAAEGEAAAMPPGLETTGTALLKSRAARDVTNVGEQAERNTRQAIHQRSEAYYRTHVAQQPVSVAPLADEILRVMESRSGALIRRDEPFRRVAREVLDVVDDPVPSMVQSRGGGRIITGDQARDMGLETAADTVWVGPVRSLPNHRALDATIDELERQIRFEAAQASDDPAIRSLDRALREVRSTNQPASRIREIDEAHEWLNNLDAAKKSLGVGKARFDGDLNAQWQSVEKGIQKMAGPDLAPKQAVLQLLEGHPEVADAVRQYVGSHAVDSLRTGLSDIGALGSTGQQTSWLASQGKLYADPAMRGLSGLSGLGTRAGVAGGAYPDFIKTPKQRKNFDLLVQAVQEAEQ